jgi:hypothetical protein
MNRQSQYPVALSTAQAPVLLNGMRVEFSERVALYPVDLEQVPAQAGDQDGR